MKHGILAQECLSQRASVHTDWHGALLAVVLVGASCKLPLCLSSACTTRLQKGGKWRTMHPLVSVLR